MKLTYKKASLKDISTVLNLEKSVTGPKTYSALLTESEVEEYLKDSQVYLVLADNQPVGSVSYEVKDKNYADINGLVINPEYQGQGIGTKTIKWLLDQLKDFKKITLVTHPENEYALKIYLKAGFKRGEIKENFFGDGEPRVELTKLSGEC